MAHGPPVNWEMADLAKPRAFCAFRGGRRRYRGKWLRNVPPGAETMAPGASWRPFDWGDAVLIWLTRATIALPRYEQLSTRVRLAPNGVVNVNVEELGAHTLMSVGAGGKRLRFRGLCSATGAWSAKRSAKRGAWGPL